MTYLKAVIAALVGALAMWITAGLFHEVVALHFANGLPAAPHENVGVILIAYTLLSVLMTFFLRHTRTAANPLLHGAIIGMVVGVLWVFPHTLSLAAAHGEPLLPVVGNAVWHVFEQGLGGVVIMAVMTALNRRQTQPA